MTPADTARRSRMAMTVIALLVACASAACTNTASRDGNGDTAIPSDLGTAEITEYRGERLGSAADFRENSIAGPQRVDRESYRLVVDGEVERPATYTYQQVVTEEATHTKAVTIHCVEGWSVKILWEGVLLGDLIDRADPRDDAVTVVFHAVDGYTTSLPLEYVREKRLLLAYGMNGVELPPERGFPFQVVAEDRYGYKWCKWVQRIELSSDTDHRGYWESRGYSNDARLPEDSP